jgi:hypothetical protein
MVWRGGTVADEKLPSFPAAAAGALAPVAGEVARVGKQAQAGGLRLDADAATVMLQRIAAVREKARGLVTDAAELGTPLRFGDNWIGEIMSERLGTLAVTERGGIAPVLERFAELMVELESIVQASADRYTTMDEAAAQDFRPQVRETP